MLALHTILHPTDLSPLSEFAFRLACSLARDHGARLVLLHVLQPPAAYGEVVTEPVTEADRQMAREALSRIQPADPDIPVDHRLAEGYPEVEILRAAQLMKCDLIVMSTHGRSGLG